MSKSRKRRQRAQLRARAKSSRNPATRSLRYEPLEDRRMLAVVTVDTDQDVVDFSDGLTSLREAIFATNLVEGPDEIVFDFGHDGPATILLTEGAFRISDSLTITGSGAELLTIDASGNDPTPDEDNGDGSRIFSIDDGQLSSNIDVTISGLTLTGGDANTLGGAIVARENLTVEDSIIRSNSVRTGGGGGIAFVQPFRRRSSSDPLSAAPLLKIIRSTVQDNSMARSTGGVGGGIFIRGNVEVEISNSTISDNSTSGDLRHGGGIAIDQFRSGIATVTIIDSTISGNSTSGENSFGGGIYNYEGNLTIIGSNITANTTSGNQSSGGGIRSTNGNVKIVDSRITDNSVSGGAAWGGGLLFRGFDPAISLTVSRTTISGNSASGPFGNGGGLHIRGHKIAIIDSAIFNNTSTRNGGGIGIFSVFSGESAAEDILIQNTTISGNHADEHGGGVFVDNLGEQSVLLSHSTIAFNESDADSSGTGSGGGLFISQDDVRLDHAIIAGNQDNTGVAHDVAGDILASFSQVGEGANFLGPLADNGGPTLTHALLPGSPAINAGNLNAVPGENGVPLFDQRGKGFDRILSRIDIGAYEVQELGDLNLLVDTLVDESDGDFSRGDLSLREAIELANANPVPDTIRFDPIFAAIAGPLPATILLTMGELAITNSVEIIGLGAELLTVDASGNDPTPDEDNGDGSRVFNIEDRRFFGFDVAISGMTLTGGDVDGSGGAVFSRENTVLVDMTIKGNAATVDGGGVFDGIWGVDISESTISNNFAGNRGGGIAAASFITSLQLNDSQVSGNRAHDGGGIFANSGPDINSSTISDNRATGSGGGLFTFATSSRAGRPFLLRDSTFSGNTAGLQGGGVYTAGETEIVGSTFTGNRSIHDGGGLFTKGETTVAGSTFSDNRSTSYSGGGLFASEATLDISASTFSGNTAFRDGGGLFAGDTYSTIRESIFKNNTATTLNGGGISNRGELSIADTTLFRNSAQKGGGLFTRDSTTITGSTIVANSARVGGGIFANNGGNLHISETSIIVNVASGENAEGGGLFLDDARLDLESSNVSENLVSSSRGGALGGGISMRSGEGRIADSIISGNRTLGFTADGGGISIDRNAVLEIVDSRISDNFASRNGGGIASNYGVLTVENTSVEENTTNDDGGGIWSRGSVRIFGSTISDNSAGDEGGGIFGAGGRSRMTIADSTISGNSTRGFDSFSDGAGLFFRDGRVEIRDSLFADNTAVDRAGGARFLFAEATIQRTTFRNNESLDDWGGAIHSSGSVVTIGDSTFHDNRALSGYGGAILTEDFSRQDAVMSITGSTLSGNLASRADAVANLSSGDLKISHSTIAGSFMRSPALVTDGKLEVSYSIVATIQRRSDSDFIVEYSLISAGGNALPPAPVGSPDAHGNLVGFRRRGIIDPRLAPLADNGGPTLTHALLPGSPAINAGDLNAIAGVDDVPLFDQRGEGLDRIFSRIDIGAYEVQELGDLNLLVDTLVDESDGDFSRGDLSLREAIELANANPVPDTIRFDPIFAAIAGPLPATILLTMGELAITDSVEIVGLGAELLKIDASGNDPTPDENNGDGSRVLFVNAPIKTLIDVAIHGITFTGADSNQSGGAIFSRDNLSLREVSIRDNHSAAFGGGIAVFWSSSQPLPTLLINHSDIDNNTAVKRGGGVFSFGLIQISESNLTGNRTSDKGGAIWANQNRVNDANDFVFHGNLLSRNYSGDRGGGAYIEIGGRDPIRVDGNVFRENTAVGSGGGAYLSGNIDFIGNIVELNSSRSFGGGVSFAGGQSTVNGQLVKAIAKVFDSQFRSNSASTGGGVAQNTSTNVLSLDSSYFIGNVASHRGGGVAIFGESLINDSKVTDNFASVGGGIYVSGFSGNTDLSIVRSEILGNESSSTGGGIHTFATFTTIRDSTVAENIASTHGGGIYAQARSKVAGDDADGGRVSVSGSTIHNNQAGGRGGAIAVAGGISSNDVGASGGQVSLSNTTISANRAGTVGGGIFAGEPVALGTGETQPALVTAEHSTITDNTAESDLTARGSGGGVFIENGSVELDHTIIAGNRNNSGTANDIAGIVNSNFSLIGFGAEFLAPLADNGGPTFTHALLSGSPAINAGDPQAVSGANGIPEFDQRGNPFTRVSGRRIDIGAYEVQPLPGDFDGDGDSDDFDLAQWEADFGITENSTSDSDGDGDTDGSDFLNWQRTLGVVLPTVENRSLAERTSETELRVAAVDLALAADKMLNGPQYGRALFTYLDDTPDFVLDLALPSLHEAPRPVQRAASRAAFELLEVTASDEDAPDELDDELSALDELFALL